MTRVTARWIGFAALFVAAPLPMLFFERALVPAARYALLAGVSLAVVAREGATGPAVGIALVFAVHALGYGLLCWIAAGLVARAVAVLPTPVGAALLWGAVALGLAVGLGFEIYRTPFGRAPWGSLLDALS